MLQKDFKGFFTGTRGIILLLLITAPNLLHRSYTQAQMSPVVVYDTYTCRFYNETYHYPDIITDFFEETDREVILWLNMSHIPELSLTAKWIYPNSTIYMNQSFQLPLVSFNNTSWCDQIISLQIKDDPLSHVLGEWSVEIYQDQFQITQHRFHLIDKESSAWASSAKIIDVEYPESVLTNEFFTVYVEVQYSFENETLLTPGIWDTETEEIYGEVYDWVVDDGTKRYTIGGRTINNTGVFHMEAAAFYQVSDEWVIDDDGLWGFTIEVREPEPESQFPYATVTVILLASILYLAYRFRSR